MESLPDVLKGMTDLAARGRTLGIHLVLATQSPAKAINEDIRDNMELRVCFRVEEKVASVDVIDIPDAAEIDPGLRGRGFARIASGAVAQFQGAWVSAPADGGRAACARGPWRRCARRRGRSRRWARRPRWARCRPSRPGGIRRHRPAFLSGQAVRATGRRSAGAPGVA